MPPPLHVAFLAGPEGSWRIDAIRAIAGPSLPEAPRLAVAEGPPAPAAGDCAWVLRATTSNMRYTYHAEAAALRARQESLSRPQATRAVLIPIRKTEAWWAMAQDERRAIMEEQSRHIGIGLDYLPAIARRLHHGRELGEPFDFLTWFEFAPEHEAAFDELLARLRATPEWDHVDREVEVRLTREG